MKYSLFLLALVGFFAPTFSQAQVLISEVAWMGTDASSAYEWIELYNFSNTPTNLDGWAVTSLDGSLTIPLSGTLGPHGVGLLERDADETIPSVTALLTYTGEMADGGTVITLKNPTGAVADQTAAGANWSGIGGSNTVPKKTSQRTRTATWITAAPTPGNENAQANDPIDVSTGTTSTSTETSTPRGSSGGSSKAKSGEKLVITGSTTATIGDALKFSVDVLGVSKNKKNTYTYTWNFGDLTVGEGAKPDHTYAFPGDYIVVVEATSSRKLIQARHDITITPQRLSLSVTKDGNVAITNLSDGELILDGYTITGGTYTFVFPKNSFLKTKAHITLARLQFGSADTIQISDVAGVILSSIFIQPNTTLVAVADTQSLSTMPELKSTRVSPAIQTSYRTPYAKGAEVVSVPKETIVTSTKSEVIDQTAGEPEYAYRNSPFNRLMKRIGHLLGL